MLLQHFAINARLFALHDHNEQQKADQLLAKLQEGQSIALVSDAGTPLINDPGYHLVRAAARPAFAWCRCRAPAPPPPRCALRASLPTASATKASCRRNQGRKDTLMALAEEPRTLIFYESTHRLLESLQDMVTVWGPQRYGAGARADQNLGNLSTAHRWANCWRGCRKMKCRRGEMVLIVEGHKAQEDALPLEALRTLALLQKSCR